AQYRCASCSSLFYSNEWAAAFVQTQAHTTHIKIHCLSQEWTDNSWGPWAIGDHGAPVSLPKLKKAYEKRTRGISWGPLLTPGPWAVPKFPNGQSAPGL
ncbi:unnamed protein product, partial [Staurois parvus]